jgi:hypothetical protein
MQPFVPSCTFHAHVPQNLDLAGLEEDPDFWNMNIDDDEVIPLRDLTKNQSLFIHSSYPMLTDPCVDNNTTCRTSPSKIKQSSVLKTSARPVNEPKKLANGNYEYYRSSDQFLSNSFHVSESSDATIHAKRKQNVDTYGPSVIMNDVGLTKTQYCVVVTTGCLRCLRENEHQQP